LNSVGCIALRQRDAFHAVVTDYAAPQCIVKVEHKGAPALSPQRADQPRDVIAIEWQKIIREGALWPGSLYELVMATLNGGLNLDTARKVGFIVRTTYGSSSAKSPGPGRSFRGWPTGYAAG
jgi:hypothetical protein